MVVCELLWPYPNSKEQSAPFRSCSRVHIAPVSFAELPAIDTLESTAQYSPCMCCRQQFARTSASGGFACFGTGVDGISFTA
jgi:hypothetical protein